MHPATIVIAFTGAVCAVAIVIGWIDMSTDPAPPMALGEFDHISPASTNQRTPQGGANGASESVGD